MAKTTEDIGLPTVLVGEKPFPIGQLTAHQIFLLKNLAGSAFASARARQAKRRADLIPLANAELDKQKPEIQKQLASIGQTEIEDVKPEELDRAYENFLNFQVMIMEEKEGYAGVNGVFIDYILGLSEDNIIEIAMILLDRYTHSRITKSWVEDHFSIEWFLDALILFLEQNNMQSILKKLNRLGMNISMQATI